MPNEDHVEIYDGAEDDPIWESFKISDDDGENEASFQADDEQLNESVDEQGKYDVEFEIVEEQSDNNVVEEVENDAVQSEFNNGQLVEESDMEKGERGRIPIEVIEIDQQSSDHGVVDGGEKNCTRREIGELRLNESVVEKYDNDVPFEVNQQLQEMDVQEDAPTSKFIDIRDFFGSWDVNSNDGEDDGELSRVLPLPSVDENKDIDNQSTGNEPCPDFYRSDQEIETESLEEVFDKQSLENISDPSGIISDNGLVFVEKEWILNDWTDSSLVTSSGAKDEESMQNACQNEIRQYVEPDLMMEVDDDGSQLTDTDEYPISIESSDTNDQPERHQDMNDIEKEQNDTQSVNLDDLLRRCTSPTIWLQRCKSTVIINIEDDVDVETTSSSNTLKTWSRRRSSVKVRYVNHDINIEDTNQSREAPVIRRNRKIENYAKSRYKIVRMYGSRKTYCKFCLEGVVDLSKHLLEIHAQESEMIWYSRLEKGSPLQKGILRHITTEGVFLHNFDVIQTGVGSLLVGDEKVEQHPLNEFAPCPNCRLWFHFHTLAIHGKPCLDKNWTSYSAYIKQSLALLPTTQRSRVRCGTLREDDTILLMGQMIYKYSKAVPVNLIVPAMTRMTRLLTRLRESSNCSQRNLVSYFAAMEVRKVVDAVRAECDYDPTAEVYGKPRLALAMSSLIDRCVCLEMDKAMKNRIYYLRNTLGTFREVFNRFLNNDILENSVPTRCVYQWCIEAVKLSHVDSE